MTVFLQNGCVITNFPTVKDINNLPVLFLDHFSPHNISTFHRHADMPKYYKSTARNVHRNDGNKKTNVSIIERG